MTTINNKAGTLKFALIALKKAKEKKTKIFFKC